jgi:hypothetical protein
VTPLHPRVITGFEPVIHPYAVPFAPSSQK